jgi:hypothetical protein
VKGTAFFILINHAIDDSKKTTDMDIDRVTAGIVSLIVSVCFFKYGNSILQYIADLQKQHHQEDLGQDQILIVRIFIAVFRISALVGSIILLYQGISSK